MNYGNICIATKTFQTSTPIDTYENGVAYFMLFGERCKCNLADQVVYHDVDGQWQLFDRVQDIVDVFTPNITVKERQRKI